MLSTVLKNTKLEDRKVLVPSNVNGNKIRFIVFTDKVAPDGVEVEDASVAQDGGVAKWYEENTCYFSTQREGVKVAMPENCSDLFEILRNIKSIDTSMLDTSAVTDMSYMFAGCSSLSNVDGLANWDVSETTDMRWLFDHCTHLVNIDGLANWDVSNVTETEEMFCCCDKITDFSALAKWNVGWVSNMRGMFEMCSIKDVNFAKNWDTSAAENMGNMFDSCVWLADLDGLKNWNISNVKTVSSMFSNCSSLVSVDVLNDWSLPRTARTNFMFHKCVNLTTPPVWYKEKGYSI
jgi:surface protein